jgi:hypothetical protein
MNTGRNELMAQAVYLAQLEAQKGTCKCKTCQILRQASNAMVNQFLGKPNPVSPNPGADAGAVIKLEEEE